MSTTDQPPAAVNPNKALWEKGDFTRIAASMRESGESLVGTLGITAGLSVLDLGCGDGTTAIPAARLGADVLGVDIAANLVEAGNERARSLGLANCRFQEGDASDLAGIDDASFDLVVSIFGAMFAPKPNDVAKEMVRVTRPGGRIVMGNWIPGDPTLVAQILRISSAFSPPPPEGFVSPMTWGVEENVVERFTGAGVAAEQVAFERDTYTFNFPGTPSELLTEFRTYYGPTMNAYAAAAADGREPELNAELDALFNEQNTSGSDETSFDPRDLPARHRLGLRLERYGPDGCGVWPVTFGAMSRERYMAFFFALGSACFFVGPFPGYARLVGAEVDGITYFVGSILFTAGGAMQTLIALPDRRSPGAGRAAWWAATIQSAGTLFFNVTTYQALHTTLSDPDYNRLVWRPDALGSVCFLVSGAIAYRASPRVGWRPARGGKEWWGPAVNLLGCIFFGISAIAGYVVPSTGSLLDLAAANWNTALGAACFLACALATLLTGRTFKSPRLRRLHTLEREAKRFV